MESELERFHKRNTSLELNIDVLRQKLKATDKEMHMERQKVFCLVYTNLSIVILQGVSKKGNRTLECSSTLDI